MLKAQLFIRKDVLYVRLNGELDQRTVDSIRIKITELIINYNITSLIINCKDLQFMDSSGIGFIIGRFNQLKEKNGIIVLCELNELCSKIVRISGVNRIVTVKNLEKEAEVYVEVRNAKIRRDAI